MDLMDATREANARLYKAMQEALPRQEKLPGIREMWDTMTGRQFLALSEIIGQDKAQRFAAEMMRRDMGG